MIIEYKRINIYGVDRIYPQTYAQELSMLTGTKTLSTSHISALKSMGYKFVEAVEKTGV